ncbi:hypothetical protein BDFG_07415 [Blastomyces dermatitidis ATCC 26199]|nr:hypothetical protein BDFG_07415 [Blastomyces dermatitidis ATCC 26199]
MSAVASVPAVNGNHDSNKDSNPEHSPSRFTAVNGRDQGALPSNSNNNNGNNSNNTGPSENNPTVAQNEEPSASATAERDRASRNSGTPARQPEQSLESANPTVQDPEATYVVSDGNSPNTNRNKRKRSESDERQTSPSSYQGHSVSRSPVSQPDHKLDPQIQGAPPNGTTHAQTASEADSVAKRARQSFATVPERSVSVQSTGNTSAWDSYDTQLTNHAQLGHQPIDSSDAQLAEALQRDVQGPDHAAKNWPTVPEGESADSTRKFTYSHTPPQERPIGPVQVGPKRKRVFSNRTKTGCMTCRRRKKKLLVPKHLAEAFYLQTTSSTPSQRRLFRGTSSIPDMSPQRHDRAPTTIHTNNGKSRPIPVDENERVPSQYITSAAGAGSRGSWSNDTWPSGPSSFTPEHPSQREFRDGPGINNISRAEQPKSDYHAALREMSHGASHQKPGMPVFQGNIEQRPKHQQPHVDTSSYPAQARLALNMEPHVAFETPKTEKEKMLAGEPYQNYFDPQLNRERERCKAALWRYNNASNPNLGISPDERRRLLKEVLIPPIRPASRTRLQHPHDCPINIGAHTWIGPNVTILGSMAMGSMQDRKGSRSKYQGRPVVIAEDCWIGAGATILPGVSLGRGAYIAPGEVVKQQILPYGFQGLKPNFP